MRGNSGGASLGRGKRLNGFTKYSLKSFSNLKISSLTLRMGGKKILKLVVRIMTSYSIWLYQPPKPALYKIASPIMEI